MRAFYLTCFLLLSLLGLGYAAPAPADDDPQADCPSSAEGCPGPGDYIDPKHPIPAYMLVHCSGHQVDEEARIKTMARMMDWCYCGNELNTKGLEYAGFSVYEDGVDLSQRNPSRTWACRQVSPPPPMTKVLWAQAPSPEPRAPDPKNKHEPCDAVEDWYNAWGNITSQCGVGSTGYFYDTDRQIAWGFETYQDKTFCDNVGWVSSST